MEALSDGVFAIVMTLLVIELSVPLVSKLKAAEELGGMLIEMWPKFLAFAISFLILGYSGLSTTLSSIILSAPMVCLPG